MVELLPTFATATLSDQVEAALRSYLTEGNANLGIAGLEAGPKFTAKGGFQSINATAIVYFQSDVKPATAAVEGVRQDATGSNVPVYGCLSGFHREEVIRYLFRTSATGGDGGANLSDAARAQDALLCDLVIGMLKGAKQERALELLGLRRAIAERQSESEGGGGFQNAVQLDFVVIVEDA